MEDAPGDFIKSNDMTEPVNKLRSFLGLAMLRSRQTGSIRARLTFPGSSFGRGVFTKHLLSDKLCLMEF